MKKYVIILTLCIVVLLAGCSNVKQELENRILESSGITADSAYGQYGELAESKQLDESGGYIDSENLDVTDVNFAETSGSIHVTFANNSYLGIQYFSDMDTVGSISSYRLTVVREDSIGPPSARFQRQ